MTDIIFFKSMEKKLEGIDVCFIILFIYLSTLQLNYFREFEATLRSSKELKNIPRIVNSNEFGFLSKMKARLRLFEKFGNLFLGYCKRHKTYFLDLEHTNGDIRCPICDKIWLLKHQKKIPVYVQSSVD